MSIDDGRAPAPEKELDQQPTSEGGGAFTSEAAVEPVAEAPEADVDATRVLLKRAPGLGEVVLYHVSEQDEPSTRHNAAKTLPAIVVATWDAGSANLKIFTDGPVNTWKTSVLRGDGPGAWDFRD